LLSSPPRTISTASSAEADRKRGAALAAAAAIGVEAVVATDPATVRWLLCGRGRPVSTAGAAADYVVLLAPEGSYALHPDIESSRVEHEERLEELGFERIPFPWHLGPEKTLEVLLSGRSPLAGDALESAILPNRLLLGDEERERYRRAGSEAAEALVETVERLSPSLSELDAAAELAYRVRQRGFTSPVVLVAGSDRQGVHRHPLPTGEPLGRHALLAVTAERAGLHVSLTRLVSFGPAPGELGELVAATARVDAAMLAASRPGTTTGAVLDVAAAAYDLEGFPEEWRRHHQGGLTGYRGREVFAVPGEPTPLPSSCAVAWNPSITGGAKSEDTTLVSAEVVEVVTRTPSLPEIDVDGLARPGMVEL
jgi:Xaa-Pro dipeptidase